MPTKRQPSARRAPDRAITRELVQAALASIPPGIGHDDRVRIAFAVYDGMGDAGGELWLDWAGGRDDADVVEDRAVWKSARKPGKVKIGTLFGLAKDHGFRFPEDGAAAAPAPSAADATRQAEEKRERQAAEEAELQRRREQAAQRCSALWEKARTVPPAGGCPYLDRKGVKAYGLRFLVDGTGLVPMRDEAGRLWSLQRLLRKPLRDKATGKDGTDKLYGPIKQTPEEEVSSRKLGLWHQLGDLAEAPVILLAEGYATAATLHEATGRPVVVCFDAGNLVHVAQALRVLHPAALLLVCGDDDRPTEARRGKNPGRIAAAKAAHAVHGPEAPSGAVFPEQLPEGAKDFNDLGAALGLQAVREQVERAIAAPVLPDAPPARERAKSGAGASNDGAGGGGKDRPPPEGSDGAARPDRWGFLLDERGVWHRKRDGDDWGKAVWLCAPLRVPARTRTDDANGWGYLLEFQDFDGNAKSWAMPSALLSGEGAEWAGRLRDMGLNMAVGPGVRTLIATYINTREPADRVTCTDRVGWHGDVYVLPSGSIGPDDARRFVYQSDGGVEDNFRRRGTLAGWQNQVAALCRGNSRLVFAVGCAFAAPLLPASGIEGGGVHYGGDSRDGKSSAQFAACSVYGGRNFKHSWRSTSNALESVAAQHNDCLLVLDEIGEADPRELGEVAYMLGNGMDKGRATRSLLNRKRRTWRLLFLSSGELGLAAKMQEAGKRVRAGQEVRMVEIASDAGRGMGVVEQLNGHNNSAELIEAIGQGTLTHYGVAGRTWLQWCAEHHAELATLVRDQLEEQRAALLPDSAGGQVRTVASRFALVAAAGELATAAGITGWPRGEAARAARVCFESWLAARGHDGNSERVAMLRQVQAFLEKNGDALFTEMHRGMEDRRPSTPLRAGFRRRVDKDGNILRSDSATEYVERRSALDSSERDKALVQYLVLPQTWRNEVCRGYSGDRVAALLRELGVLKHDAGKLTSRQRLPGMGKAPCYLVLPGIFELDL